MLANDPATTCGASSSFNNAIGAHATIIHNIFSERCYNHAKNHHFGGGNATKY
jgi:hypothetical protein